MQGPLIALSGPEGAEREQALALARHLQGLLLSSGHGWTRVEIEASAAPELLPDALLGATAAAASLPFPVLSLDLAAASAMAPARQHLLLRDRAETLMAALDRSAATPAGGAERTLGTIRLLRQAEALLAYDPATGDRLRQLGCAVRATVPFPALPPVEAAAPGDRSAARRVLVINHLAPAAPAARNAIAALRGMLPFVPLSGVVEAPASDLPRLLSWPASRAGAALAHIHVGLPPDARPGCAAGATPGPRLVDSLACRCPVLLHLPRPEDAVAPAPIAHEIDGLISRDDTGLVAGLRNLLEDEVFAGILARNAERRVLAHNHACAAALREALPELFG